MKERVRILSAMLAVFMILGALGSFSAFADVQGPGPGRVTLFKFDTLSAIEAVNKNHKDFISPSIEQLSALSDLSMKVVSPGNSDAFFCENSVTDLSGYGFLKIKLYACQSGTKFNVILTTNAGGGNSANPYYRKAVTINKIGWQELAIPLVDSEANSAGFGANYDVDWTHLSGLYVNFGGWGIEQYPGHTLYFDEFWVEKPEMDYSGGEVTDGKVLVDFDRPDKVETTGGVYDYPQTINARQGGNGMYASVDIGSIKNTKNITWMLFDQPEAEDLSAYRYLNFWVYSPKISGGGVQAVVYSDVGGNKYVTKGLGTMDWWGWKLISLDMSSWGGFDLSHVERINLVCNGWINGDGGGSTAAVWFESGSYGIEKVWASAEQPADSAEGPPPSTGTPVRIPGENKVVAEFNQADSIAAYRTKGFTANTRNNHLYQMNARSNKWGDIDLFNADTTSPETIRNTKIQVEDYQYVNAWIYNPAVKTFGDKISQLNWIFVTGTAPDDASFSGAYGKYKLTMDWTGWKLVTVPLSEITNGNWNGWQYGVCRIYFNANGWANETTKWADGVGNYIDVDNIWLSKEVPPTTFGIAENGLSVADGAEDVDTSLDAYTITFDREIANESIADLIEVYEGFTRLVRDTDYSVAVDGNQARITFIGELAAGIRYQVKLKEGIRDGYGNQMKLQDSIVYTFNTRPETAYTIQNLRIEGTTAKVDIKVNDNQSYPFTLVIAESDGEKMTACTIGETQNLAKQPDDSFQSLTLPLETATGVGTLKAMLWDDPVHMRPYLDCVTLPARQ